MQRSSIIATVIAAGGVLMAGSVASVAVINAASLTPHDSETVSVVAAGAPSTSSTESTEVLAEDGTGTPIAAPASSAATIPDLAVEELPELPDVAATESETDTRPIVVQEYVAPTRTAAPTRAPQTNTRPSKPKRPSQAASASASAAAEQVAWITSDAARDIVLTATNGGEIKGIKQTTRGEYSAWAVQLVRHDGSIVTGYVEAGSGVIFDWVVNQEAPAPATPSSNSGSGSSGDDSADGQDDDDESEDHGGDDDDD